MKAVSTFLLVISFFTVFGQVDTSKKVDQPENALKIKPLIIPTALMTYGFLRNTIMPIKTLDISTRNEIMQNHPMFSSNVDDYAQWVPAGSLLLMTAAGMKTEHKIKDQAIIYVMSTVLMSGSVFTFKKITNQYRPDSSSRSSFPSGHTANAFVGAEMIHQELKNTHPVLSYAGYLVASATGIYRMLNNRHWLSDVIAGAGFGMLSTRASYFIFGKFHSGKANRKPPVL